MARTMIGNKTQAALLSLLLAGLTLAVYWPVIRCRFLDYDDLQYVVQNSHVNHGMSWGDVRWALTSYYASNWHPLTWISHMLDCQLYGLNPAGHHATNLVFHIFNTVLIFLLLRSMTGAQWRSAFVAALFALHPMHVESVAWVAERKDVLSTFFWALTILAYVRYVRGGRGSCASYCMVLLFYALGLMAKSMLVTLPFLLLLLDVWPLRRGPAPMRIAGREYRIVDVPGGDERVQPSLARMILEKVPLLVMVVFTSLLTLLAQSPAMGRLAQPFWFRAGNALLAYGQYLEKAVWPTNLGVLYPFPESLAGWRLAVAAAVLGCLSFVAIRHVRRQPYLFTGWFWFLGALTPTLGLVQVGYQSMADRYTYVPLIGLFIIVAWGGEDLAGRWRFGRILLSALAIAAIAACALVTRVQLRCWHDSVALFEHTLQVAPSNPTIQHNLEAARAEAGIPAPPANPARNP